MLQNWLYQIKTHTAEQTKELRGKLQFLGFKGLHGDFLPKKGVVVLINNKKGISFNWKFEDDGEYGIQTDYTSVADLVFLKQNGIDLGVPAMPPAKKYSYIKIIDIKEGDIYCSEHCSIGLIIKHYTGKFSILGNDDGLLTYSNCQDVNKEEMINWLNKEKYVLMRNINSQVVKSLQYCQKEFDAGKE